MLTHLFAKRKLSISVSFCDTEKAMLTCFYWCMDSGFYQTGAWCMVSRLYVSTIYWLMWRLFIYVLDKSCLDQILYNCMNYTTSTNKTCIHCAALHHLSPVQIKLESHGVQNRGSYCNLSAVLPRSLLFPQKTDGLNGFKTDTAWNGSQGYKCQWLPMWT